MRRIRGGFDATAKSSEASAKRMTSAFRTIGAGAALMTAGIVGLAAINSATKAVGRFDIGLARVGATMRATTEEMNKLRDSAIEAGIRTQFSPTQAVEGLQNLAQAGFDATDATTSLIPALDLAAAGQIGVGDATAIMVASIKGYGVAVGDAGLATDQLIRITQKTQLSALELRQGLANAARGALTLKQGLGELLPAMGLIRDTGLDVSVAGTAISSAVDFMSRRAKEFNDIAGTTVRVTDEVTGKFRPFLDIIVDTSDALAGITDEAERSAKVTNLFGRFGKTAFLAISESIRKGIKDSEGNLLRGRQAIAFLREEMEKAGGTGKRVREALLDTLEGQRILLTGSLETLKIQIGEFFKESFKPVVTRIINFVNALIERMQALSPQFKNILGKLAVFGSLALVVTGAIVAFAGVMKLLAVVGIAGLGALLLIFAKVLLVIGLVVAAAFVLKKAWDANFLGIQDITAGFIEALGETYSTIKELLLPVFALLGETFSELFGAVKSLLVQLGLFGENSDTASNRLRIFGKILAGVLGGAVTVIALVVAGVAGALAAIAKVFTFITNAISDAITFWFGLPWKQVGETIMAPFKAVADFVTAVWEGIVFGFKTAINFIVNLARTAAGTALGLATDVLDLLPKAVRPAWVNDLIETRKELAKPINVFAEATPTPARAIPVDTAPARVAQPAATVIERVAAARAQPEPVSAGAERGGVQENRIIVNVGGEQIVEAVDRKRADDRAREGSMREVFTR